MRGTKPILNKSQVFAHVFGVFFWAAQLAIKFETQIMLFHAREVKSGCLCVPSGEIKGPDSSPYCNGVSYK